MARYRTLNNDTEINVDGVRLRAGVDGVFDVAEGSRAEQVLLAGGALPVDGSGMTGAELSGLRALLSGPSEPHRVLLLGDSLTQQLHRSVSGAAATVVSPTDVSVAPLGSARPPVGSHIGVRSQADADLNIDVPIVSNAAASMTVRYPFDVTGRISGSVSYLIYATRATAGWWLFAEAALAAAGMPVKVVRHAGVSGQNLIEIRKRVARDIAAYAVVGDIVVVGAGINGAISGGLAGSSETDMVDQLGLLYDELLSIPGVTVLASTITQAQSAAYWADPAIALANTRVANGYIRGRCASEARMQCFDAHAALGGGDYAASGMVLPNDVHYLPTGAATVGARFVADCGSLFAKRSARRVLSAHDSYPESDWNLVSNPSFAGATGTTPPTGWQVSNVPTGTYGFAANARADGIGNDLTITQSHTASATGELQQNIYGRVIPGRRYMFGIEYETIAQGTGCCVTIGLELTVGGVVSQYRTAHTNNSYAEGARLPPQGTRYLFEVASGDNLGGRNGVLIPYGVTDARLFITWNLGASGSMSFIVARPHLYELV